MFLSIMEVNVKPACKVAMLLQAGFLANLLL